MYGIYVLLLFRIFCFASLEKIPLCMLLTTCRKYRKRIRDHLIHFLTRFTAFVYLMKNFSVFDEKNSGRMAGCLCAVRNHKNRLSLCIDFAKYGKKC